MASRRSLLLRRLETDFEFLRELRMMLGYYSTFAGQLEKEGLGKLEKGANEFLFEEGLDKTEELERVVVVEALLELVQALYRPFE